MSHATLHRLPTIRGKVREQMHGQRGAVLMVLLLSLGLLAAYFALSSFNHASRNERQHATAVALAQAREALIGAALVYDFNYPGEAYGYLHCPDTSNNGTPNPPCGAQNISVWGRLPWRVLGLPPLRDHGGECLWYAVSGSAKNNPKSGAFNWDTTGQFIIRDADGMLLAGASPHERPLALVLAAGAAIGAQSRGGGVISECGGHNNSSAYLESMGAPVSGLTTVTLATHASTTAGTNNDVGLWINSAEIFAPIMRRADFSQHIDVMLNDLAACLDNLPPAALPAASNANKGVLNATTVCPPASLEKDNNLRNNWENNLLYTRPATTASIATEGVTTTGCHAVLLFGGARTTAPAQLRDNAVNKDNPAMYLEGGNAALFPHAGAYVGRSHFDAATPSSDLLRCIHGLPADVQTVSFANDFANFTSAGSDITPSLQAVRSKSTVNLGDASGNAAGVNNSGCFWYPEPIALLDASMTPATGKVLRIYYRYRFSRSDPAGGIDIGQGFTLQLLGATNGPPQTCGAADRMGVLEQPSILIETDIQRDAAHNDPAENHTAIMLHGELTHSAANGALSSACDGSAAACRHALANHFEESPPTFHNQRIEIHTGCDANCNQCNPASHAPPNSHARISVWVDCHECLGIGADLDRSRQAPTINQCIDLSLNPALNSLYLGFTGGFPAPPNTSPATPRQGVTIGNFYLGNE